MQRLRRELINIPARLTRPARRLTLQPPPGGHATLLVLVLGRLQALPTARTG